MNHSDAAAIIQTSARRCFVHGERAAAVRCPSCERYYCRECVSDHKGRMLCQSCLSLADDGSAKTGGRFAKIKGVGTFLISAVAIWFLFYLAGALLSRIPTQFHRNPAEYITQTIEQNG